ARPRSHTCSLLELRMFLLRLMAFCHRPVVLFFFFNDTATTELYTLSLHDALPISADMNTLIAVGTGAAYVYSLVATFLPGVFTRSEEHTSELQSLAYLVCRLLLEKKKHQDMKLTHAPEEGIVTSHATSVADPGGVL